MKRLLFVFLNSFDIIIFNELYEINKKNEVNLMKDCQTKINPIIENLDQKKNKKLQTDLFLRLCEKVGEEDLEITAMVNDTFLLLTELSRSDTVKIKDYYKSLALLKKTARKKLGYIAKGSLQEEYMALGVGVGVAMGAAFVTTNPAFIGIFMPIGLAVGLAIGKKKEDEAEKSGKIY